MKIPKSIRADLALIAATFIWGSTFTIVKTSLAQVSPILLVALRFWIATVILLAFMPGQIRKISGRTLGQGLFLALVVAGGFILQTVGLRSTSPSLSAFITGLSVLLVPWLGYIFFRHRPRPQTIAGVFLATIGLYLLLVNISAIRMGSGEMFSLICAVLFAFQILFLSRFVSVSDYRQLILLEVGGTAILATVLIPFVETPFLLWNLSLAVSFFITGVLATALALYVQARAQQFTSANRAALIFSLEPFFAVLFAYWIMGQVLTAREWIGGVLILSGILVSELRSKQGSVP